MPKPFIVTGTGRCGTGYIAKAFTAIGVPCGHEEIFTPYGIMDKPNLVGDSSWLAAAYFFSMERRPLIIHVRRNPLHVLNSLLGLETLWIPAKFNDWGQWLHDKMPILESIPEPANKITEFFLAWVDLIHPYANKIWRVEDMEPADFAEIAFEIGYDHDELTLDQLTKVPKDYNSHPHPTHSWEFWKEKRHGQDLFDLAGSWGYL